MTYKQIQQNVVAKGKTRLGKNTYTQGTNRTKVASGWSDCSSFARWCWKEIANIDIGANTATQIGSKQLITIQTASGSRYPNVAKLELGDLIYFKGNKNNPQQVGHVEVISKVGKTIGECQCIGHGSGKGPTTKNLKSYCDSRAGTRGYLAIRRPKIIEDMKKQISAPTNPTEVQKGAPKVTVTGNNVYVRILPDAAAPSLGITKKGNTFTYNGKVSGTWYNILYNNKSAWISAKYTKLEE